MNQQKVVNHCYRLNGNLIFPHSKIFSALIVVCKLTSRNRHGLFLRLGWYLLCCALVIKRDQSIGVNLRGPQTLNIPSCDPPPKSIKQKPWLPKHNTIDNSQNASRHHACLALTSHCVNLYHIKAEYILLCGEIRILSVAIQPVTVMHNFPLICIGEV